MIRRNGKNKVQVIITSSVISYLAWPTEEIEATDKDKKAPHNDGGLHPESKTQRTIH